MILYDLEEGKYEHTDGGYSRAGIGVKDEYVGLKGGTKGILYRPQEEGPKSKVGIVLVHSHEDYSTFDVACELARYGYTVVSGRVRKPESLLDEKFMDIASFINFLKSYSNAEKIVLIGHSGGATLMTGYQRAAENGIPSLKKDNMVFKCTLLDDEVLPKADAMLILDSNFGNGAMTAISIDPAVMNEGNGRELIAELDSYNCLDSDRYSDEFKHTFFKAQKERNNRILKNLLERVDKINASEGNYLRDEPLSLAGAQQMKPCNKLINHDISLLSHTQKEYDLYKADGTVSHEIIRCLRKKFDVTESPTVSIFGTLQSTVKEYVCEHGVYLDDDYCIKEDGIYGVKWENTYNCTPGNVVYIKAPMLIVGMTGSYEFIASEIIYENSSSEDKEIAFIEGAGHNFAPNREAEKYDGEFGDTRRRLYDLIDRWLSDPKRKIVKTKG